METIDDTIAAYAIKFMKKQADARKPMFVWINFTKLA
jgi:arylsulfatase